MPTTDPRQPAHRGSAPMRSRAGRGLAMVSLGTVLVVGRAGAQQSAAIQASAVVAPSFVEVAVVPSAGGAAGADRPELAWKRGIAGAGLVQARGVSGASVRTVVATGRGPAGCASAAEAASAGRGDAMAPGASRQCVVVEYLDT